VCSKAHLNKAYERFTQDGPIALLPLTENRYSLVWSIKNTDIERLTDLSESAFLSELQQAFGYRAGIFQTVGKRDIYPLKLIKISKPVTHRGLCIGNAAHCLHPVMGQGFNLGLRDLYVLAQVISQIEERCLIGGYPMVNQYWSARQDDHKKTMQMTDLMVRIFSNNSWPFIAGRNIALQAMSCFPSLTQPIVKQAKGQFTLNGINNDSIL
jgi:2-octaprenyl-6-methoxyphenol hydroxylase